MIKIDDLLNSSLVDLVATNDSAGLAATHDSVNLVTTDDSASLAVTHGSADWAIYYSWLIKISSAATKLFFYLAGLQH